MRTGTVAAARYPRRSRRTRRGGIPWPRPRRRRTGPAAAGGALGPPVREQGGEPVHDGPGVRIMPQPLPDRVEPPRPGVYLGRRGVQAGAQTVLVVGVVVGERVIPVVAVIPAEVAADPGERGEGGAGQDNGQPPVVTHPGPPSSVPLQPGGCRGGRAALCRRPRRPAGHPGRARMRPSGAAARTRSGSRPTPRSAAGSRSWGHLAIRGVLLVVIPAFGAAGHPGGGPGGSLLRVGVAVFRAVPRVARERSALRLDPAAAVLALLRVAEVKTDKRPGHSLPAFRLPTDRASRTRSSSRSASGPSSHSPARIRTPMGTPGQLPSAPSTRARGRRVCPRTMLFSRSVTERLVTGHLRQLDRAPHG